MSLDALREITKTRGWRVTAELLVHGGKALPANPEDVSTYWIEAGHRIREQVDDDRLLCRMLRNALPPYDGEAILVYRGENIGRLKTGSVGFAWTPKIEVARMFGRGLNSIETGGALLRAAFSPQAVISGPNGHSTYLGEVQFTADPSLAQDMQVLEMYPSL